MVARLKNTYLPCSRQSNIIMDKNVIAIVSTLLTIVVLVIGYNVYTDVTRTALYRECLQTNQVLAKEAMASGKNMFSSIACYKL